MRLFTDDAFIYLNVVVNMLGAGLLMRAVVEEGDESLAARMQQLALSEAALPRHLLTAFYTRKTAGKIVII